MVQRRPPFTPPQGPIAGGRTAPTATDARQEAGRNRTTPVLFAIGAVVGLGGVVATEWDTLSAWPQTASAAVQNEAGQPAKNMRPPRGSDRTTKYWIAPPASQLSAVSRPGTAPPGSALRPTTAPAARPPKPTRSEPQRSDQASRQDAPEPGPIDVRIERILVGGEALAAGVVDESLLNTHAKTDKYVVYFTLQVSPAGTRGTRRISFEDFRLEDRSGLIYTPLSTRDRLSATLGAGETARGGVAFAVYNDSAPARLLLRTGADSFTPLPETVFSPARD